MIISQKGKKLLEELEGFRSCPYLDSVKIPTIGIGTTIYPNGKRVAMTDSCITLEEAYEYLDDHVARRISPDVQFKIKRDLNQNQIDALISFIYNVGTNGFNKSTLLKKINKNPNDRQAIEFEFMRWSYAGGKPVLTKRRKKEVELYFS